MNSESEFRTKCRPISFQACLDHLTSCIENRHRPVKIAIEPKDPEDFLEALDELCEKISNAEFLPNSNDGKILVREHKIRRARRQLNSTFSTFEAYQNKFDTRRLFRSSWDKNNYHKKLRCHFEETRTRLQSDIDSWLSEIEKRNVEIAKHPELHRRGLLGQCEQLRSRGHAWANESKVSTIPWVILPRGTWGKSRDQIGHCGETNRIHEQRLDRILELDPSRIFRGVHEFSGYFAFTFESSEWVIFESDRFGNALYLVRGNWVAMSRMSKKKLLAVASGNARRIVHKGDWFVQLQRAMEFRQS